MPYLDDINVPEPEGVGPVSLNVKDGKRSSPWSAYVEPVLENRRLNVLVEATVKRLVLHDLRCTGVEVEIGTGRHTMIYAQQEVILCAGAIDSPRILMYSGIGDAEELAGVDIKVHHHLPGVGKNLQEHILLGGLCFAPRAQLPPFNNNLEGSTLFWKSQPNLSRPDLIYVSIQIPYVMPELASQYPVSPDGFSIAPGLVGVASRGYLRLRTQSSGIALEIQPRMLSEPQDLDALVAGVEIGFDLADQASFRNIIASWQVPPRRLSRGDVIEFVRQSASPYFHPVGTCAMGSGEEAVVDHHLKVHGIDNLRVADASIMPTITSANTNAPTVMIAEVAAAKIIAAIARR